MADIVAAAKQRFLTGYFLYGDKPNFDGTAIITRGTQKGIGIDCSNLVSQSLLSAGYNVNQLHYGDSAFNCARLIKCIATVRRDV